MNTLLFIDTIEVQALLHILCILPFKKNEKFNLKFQTTSIL